jgi:hypothetical protein
LIIGQQFLDAFKAGYGVDVAIHIQEGKTFKDAWPRPGVRRPHTVRRASRNGHGRRFPAQGTVVNGKSQAIYAAALNDYSGNPFGVVEGCHGQTAVCRRRLPLVQRNGLLLGLLRPWVLGKGIAAPGRHGRFYQTDRLRIGGRDPRLPQLILRRL